MDKSKIALLSLICALLIWQTASLHRKWEYRVEYIPDATYNSVLEKLGQERWEIISARRATTSTDLSSTTKEYGYEVIARRAKWL